TDWSRTARAAGTRSYSSGFTDISPVAERQVSDGEYTSRVTRALSVARGGDSEADELVEGECFRATAWIDVGVGAQGSGTGWTSAETAREGIGQILSALAEGGQHDLTESGGVRGGHAGLGAHTQVENRRVDLRRRPEGSGRHRESQVRLTGELRQNRQASICPAPGEGGHALGDFLLKHESHLVDGLPGLDKGHETGTAHAVWQIADDQHTTGRIRLERGQPRVIERPSIGHSDLDMGRVSEALHEGGRQPRIDFDGQKSPGRAGEVTGEGALPWSDLEDEIPGSRAHQRHDALGDGVVAEEMLAEGPCFARGRVALGRRD